MASIEQLQRRTAYTRSGSSSPSVDDSVDASVDSHAGHAAQARLVQSHFTTHGAEWSAHHNLHLPGGDGGDGGGDGGDGSSRGRTATGAGIFQRDRSNSST